MTILAIPEPLSQGRLCAVLDCTGYQIVRSLITASEHAGT
jgi:hypothetical protein